MGVASFPHSGGSVRTLLNAAGRPSTGPRTAAATGSSRPTPIKSQARPVRDTGESSANEHSAQGGHPRRRARDAIPSGDEEPTQRDAPRHRQADDPVRRRGGGAAPGSPTSSSSPAGASAPSRTTSTATSSSTSTWSRARRRTSSRRWPPSRRWPTSTTSASATRSGLGHAVSVARQHVGNEPFAVMLGDDIMVDDSPPAPLHARGPRALWPVGHRHPRGPPGGHLVLRLRDPRGGGGEPRPGAGHRREAEAGGGPVEPGRHRPLRVHARDLRRPRPNHAGRGRRAPAHRRHRPAAADPDGVRLLVRQGRYDIGKKIDFLRATVELALDRPDLGDEFRAFLADLVQRRKIV